jgi:hypothetical protein
MPTLEEFHLVYDDDLGADYVESSYFEAFPKEMAKESTTAGKSSTKKTSAS